MGFKHFRINVAIRVLLLTATLFLLFFLLYSMDLVVAPILVIVAVIFQVISLFRYVDKINRDLTSFLESIRYSDFSRSFQVEGLGSSFDKLKEMFNNVMLDFQRIRSEKEEHYYYLQNIIEHVEISIVAYRNDGTVEMVNPAAKRLFQISRLTNVKELKKWSPELVDKLLNMKQGENALIKVNDNDELLQLAVYASEFVLNERGITLVTIKNIQTELEEQEMEAWQKLIRVLTHEIMNSIAPIASLTSTMNMMVDSVAQEIQSRLPKDFDNEPIDDIRHALKTIHKRSTGLIHFVETYRNLTRIPKPNFAIFDVQKLFDNILALLGESLKKAQIETSAEITPANLQLTADEQLIEQVIINLVKNSIHALEHRTDGKIMLKAYVNRRGRTIVQVTDNGQGIIKEVRDKIFIPFFTTKKSGSGIGLSLSKQILRLHGGTIAVHSIPDKETIFTLTF